MSTRSFRTGSTTDTASRRNRSRRRSTPSDPPACSSPVDCGITSCDAVDEAVRRGIDVIVTDHHEAGQQLPNAIAIINPKVLSRTRRPPAFLAGAGAAFKLSHAFIKYGREHNLGGFQTRLEEVLDYVALGTVADIVPLLGENRIMVKYGIEALRRQIRPGVRALIESSKLRSELTPADITFRMAPAHQRRRQGRRCERRAAAA